MIHNIDYIGNHRYSLAIDLEVGIKYAKELVGNKPFVSVNHMEGYVFSSSFLIQKGKGLNSIDELLNAFPVTCFVCQVNIKYIKRRLVSKVRTDIRRCCWRGF